MNSTGSIIFGVRTQLTGNSGTGGTKYGIRSDVSGTAPANFAGYFSASGGTTNHALQLVDGSQAANRVLTSDASGIATWTDLSTISSGSTAWTRATPNIYPTTLTDNVGIGLTSPTTKMQIHATSGAGNLRLTSATTGTLSTDGFMLSNDGSNAMWMTQYENADWYFSTNGGTVAMTINPTGNVGIGTLSAGAKLEVAGSVSISGANTNELNRAQTTDANLVPIAYGNITTPSTGALNISSSTANVTLASHTSLSGNYYYTIAGESIGYLDYVVIATLNSNPGEISWSSAGGQLVIQTFNSAGTLTDKMFNFIVYKK